MGVQWIVLITFSLFNFVFGSENHIQLCRRNNTKIRSCTPQILGKNYTGADTCTVHYIDPNSSDCVDYFGPIENNAHIGGVSLRPLILSTDDFGDKKFFVLNITFSNIKWKTMKFRFQKYRKLESYCRNIILSKDLAINDQSVLYYDCYSSPTEGAFTGQSHILDFEANNDGVVNRGRYYFNIPSPEMLSPNITEKEYKPFVYIEILTSKMKLHILPPAAQLNLTSYQVEVMKECDNKNQCHELIKTAKLKVRNITAEVTYEYSLLISPGTYYFVITSQHSDCKSQACQSVESPRITIKSEVHQTMSICIVSLTALLLAALVVCYLAVRLIRRYWCKEYAMGMLEVPAPTKILIVYPSANRLHAECVASFVAYLRAEYGFELLYDGDIATTTHGDPFKWADDAFGMASHIVYIVGPTKDTNLYNNIYDNPIITAHKNVDTILLKQLEASKAANRKKDVMNIFFEHSDREYVPIQTRHDKKFFLLKDWQKFIAHLSKNLVPKKQILRTEEGKCFLDNLSRAKKLLNDGGDELVIKFDKNCFVKKAVL